MVVDSAINASASARPAIRLPAKVRAGRYFAGLCIEEDETLRNCFRYIVATLVNLENTRECRPCF